MGVIEAETHAALETTETVMTTADVAELLRYEAVIKRGLATFLEVGTALTKIRDGKLYRGTHGTFEDYCQTRWGISRSYAHRMIEAAEVVDNLLPMGNILPANERQARPLTKLEPEQQQAAWAKAVEDSGDKQPTAAQVQKAAVEFAPKPPTYAPVWELEGKVREWLDAEAASTANIHDGRDADRILDALHSQMQRPLETGTWLDTLDRVVTEAGLSFRKRELASAIDNVRDQRRQAKRQSEARVVYVEPVAEPSDEEAQAAAEVAAEREAEEEERLATPDVVTSAPKAEPKPKKASKPSMFDAAPIGQLEAVIGEWLAAQHDHDHDPDTILAEYEAGAGKPQSRWRTSLIKELVARKIDFWPDDLGKAVANVQHQRALVAELEGQWTEPELAAHAVENKAFYDAHPLPQPDPRIAEARAGIDAINAARIWVRDHYFVLLGRDYDPTGFWRDTSLMLQRLESLAFVLGGEGK